MTKKSIADAFGRGNSPTATEQEFHTRQDRCTSDNVADGDLLLIEYASTVEDDRGPYPPLFSGSWHIVSSAGGFTRWRKMSLRETDRTCPITTVGRRGSSNRWRSRVDTFPQVDHFDCVHGHGDCAIKRDGVCIDELLRCMTQQGEIEK